MISLLEFLQTANQEKFISLLKKEFGKDRTVDVFSLKNAENKDKEKYETWGNEIIIFRITDSDEELNKSEENHLVEFCRKYNYVCSMYLDGDYIIEPIQSQEVISGKIVYHITTQDIYDNFISKKGLKCRGNRYRRWTKIDNELVNNPSIYDFGSKTDYSENGSYRSITPRIYVIASRAQKIIYKIANQIGKSGCSGNSEGVVLKIDLRKHKNIKLYKDNCNPEKFKAYYTLEDIPPELITIDDDLTELIRAIIYI